MIRKVARPAKHFGHRHLIRMADRVASKDGTETYIAKTSEYDDDIVIFQATQSIYFSDVRDDKGPHYTSDYARSMNRDMMIGAEPMERFPLRLVPSRAAEPYWHDVPGGVVWRCFQFIGSRPVSWNMPAPDVPGQCFAMLSRLHEKHCGLPASFRHMFCGDFAKSSRHQDALRNAISMNPIGRVAKCHEEILDASACKPCIPSLPVRSQSGYLPNRENPLEPAAELPVNLRSDFGFCPVDLHAVAPGLCRYGQLGENIVFADNRKSAGCHPAQARETDNPPDLPSLAVLLEEFHDILTLREFMHLVQRGRHLAHSLGVIFLSDYILGDIEYPSGSPDHNLHRAREMFKLSLRMETCKDRMLQVKRDIQLV